jgi:dienelactone hydrolase
VRRLAHAAAATGLAALAGCGPGPAPPDEQTLTAPPPPLRAEQSLDVPETDAVGAITTIATRVCRPTGKGPFPLAILNHAAAQPGEDRAEIGVAGCDSPLPRWFLDHDYVVALPLRRGYGRSDAGWAADPGSCASPDYVKSGFEAARDIAAVADYLEKSPDVRPHGLVVAGEDEGGWAALAFASVPANTDLAAVIDVDGGMGGHAASETGHVCRPDLLVDAAGTFGKTTRVPTLWIYASNDPVFPPELARAMLAAFTGAGGKAEFAAPASPEGDGHVWMFSGPGTAVWSPLLDGFLKG